jgi:amidophosphoribosyltransferase
VRDLEPGEIVAIDAGGVRSVRFPRAPRQAMCAFEHIYFQRPDSRIEGRLIYSVRREMGRLLARQGPTDADLVIGVPDSAIAAATGFAEAAGLPYADGFVRNRYIGRTFIEPTQDMRERGVALKFNALTENLAGKRVIMIDDSLVRGTTAGPLVKLVRDAGATEVHLRITCPPITHACHFGVDMGHDGDLMAARLTVDEMRDRIGADSLAFLSLDGMMRAVGASEGYCNACFTGRYPIAVGEAQAKLSFEGALA